MWPKKKKSFDSRLVYKCEISDVWTMKEWLGAGSSPVGEWGEARENLQGVIFFSRWYAHMLLRAGVGESGCGDWMFLPSSLFGDSLPEINITCGNKIFL